MRRATESSTTGDAILAILLVVAGACTTSHAPAPARQVVETFSHLYFELARPADAQTLASGAVAEALEEEVALLVGVPRPEAPVATAAVVKDELFDGGALVKFTVEVRSLPDSGSSRGSTPLLVNMDLFVREVDGTWKVVDWARQ
ncbi:MAG: hypothetical protein ACE5IK_04855 [Acidobacteriota bacterium]